MRIVHKFQSPIASFESEYGANLFPAQLCCNPHCKNSFIFHFSIVKFSGKRGWSVSPPGGVLASSLWPQSICPLAVLSDPAPRSQAQLALANGSPGVGPWTKGCCAETFLYIDPKISNESNMNIMAYY